MYETIKRYPADERYCLTSDTKRAANSIAHNIAEGFGRYEPKDKTGFYKISRGSSFELISQAIVAFRLGYIKQDNIYQEILDLAYDIVEELTALIKTLENK